MWREATKKYSWVHLKKLTHSLLISLIRFDSFRDYKNQHSSQTKLLEIDLIVWARSVRGWYISCMATIISRQLCTTTILTLLYVWLLASAPGSCLMCSREYLSANHSDGNQFLESHCNTTLDSQSTHPHHHHYVISFLYFKQQNSSQGVQKGVVEKSQKSKGFSILIRWL